MNSVVLVALLHEQISYIENVELVVIFQDIKYEALCSIKVVGSSIKLVKHAD